MKRPEDKLSNGDHVKVRLTPREHEELQRRADAAGMTMGVFVRQVLRHAMGMRGFYTECQLAQGIMEADRAAE